jgi:hypothetical protein
VIRHPIFNSTIFLSEVSRFPDKDKTGHETVPFFPKVQFYLEVTENIKLHTQSINGIWMAVTFTIHKLHCTVGQRLHCAWLLQQCEHSYICSTGNRKPINVLSLCIFRFHDKNQVNMLKSGFKCQGTFKA